MNSVVPNHTVSAASENRNLDTLFPTTQRLLGEKEQPSTAQAVTYGNSNITLRTKDQTQHSIQQRQHLYRTGPDEQRTMHKTHHTFHPSACGWDQTRWCITMVLQDTHTIYFAKTLFHQSLTSRGYPPPVPAGAVCAWRCFREKKSGWSNVITRVAIVPWWSKSNSVQPRTRYANIRSAARNS